MKLARQFKGWEIEYFFEENLTLGKPIPKLGRDGKVDYRECTNIIQNVVVDQVLAKRIFEDEKEGSMSSSPCLPCGKNVYVPEKDPNVILASINGYVYVKDGEVCVSDTYCIEGDVGLSTGNITFVGNLIVNGNIKQGFLVKVGRALHVRGTIEPSEVEAVGDIKVDEGIIGDKKSILKSMGSVRMAYARNANIMAHGDVISENSLMFSNVISKGSVEILGAGKVSGGRVEAEKWIHAKIVGAKMATPTMIRVGVDPFVCEKFRVVSRKLKGLDKEIEELEKSLMYVKKTKDSFIDNKDEDFTNTIEALKARCGILKGQRNLYKRRHCTLRETLCQYVENGDREKCVFVAEELVYPGVTVEILGIRYDIKDDIPGGIFRRTDGEIKVKPFVAS